MNRMNDSGTRRGWSRKRRFNRAGAFLAQGVQFPFEPIDESANWPSVDFACFASGAFWDALVRKPRVCGNSEWSLADKCIMEAASALDLVALQGQLAVLQQQITRVRGAYVVLGWLDIQIQKEVFFAMLVRISNVIDTNKLTVCKRVKRARAG